MNLSSVQLVDAYRRMREIRRFEENSAELVTEGRLHGFVHLFVGEEALAVEVCAHLSERDVVTSTHRGHRHRIAKGVDVGGMTAELSVLRGEGPALFEGGARQEGDGARQPRRFSPALRRTLFPAPSADSRRCTDSSKPLRPWGPPVGSTPRTEIPQSG